MKLFAQKGFVVTALLLGGLLLQGPEIVAAQADSAGTETEPDSSQSYPERVSARGPFETALWLPGAIAYLPFRAASWSASTTVGWVLDTKVPQRIADYLSTDDGLRALQPTYSSQNGAGLNLYQRGLLSPEGAVVLDRLNVGGSLGLEGRYAVQINWERIPAPGFAGRLRVHGIQRNYTTEPFFGRGPHSSEDDLSRYAHERLGIGVQYTTVLFSYGDFRARAGWHRNRVGESADNDAVQTVRAFPRLPGVGERAELGYAGLGLLWDSRNRPGNPSRGFEAVVEGEYFDDLQGGAWRFSRSSFDASAFLPLFYGRVLALRYGLTLTRALAEGGEVPFYYLPGLGHRSTIRGFPRNRFVGRDRMLGSLEYRVPIRNIWEQSGMDAAFFVDAGQVSEEGFFRDVRFDQIQVAVGAGLRFWTLEGLPLKIEVAKSREMWRFYLVLNEEQGR